MAFSDFVNHFFQVDYVIQGGLGDPGKPQGTPNVNFRCDQSYLLTLPQIGIERLQRHDVAISSRPILTFVHISVTKWCIVEYGSGAF